MTPHAGPGVVLLVALVLYAGVVVGCSWLWARGIERQHLDPNGARPGEDWP